MGTGARPAEVPAHWPPEGAYREAADGWKSSEKSEDWLYKPKSGVYFHNPTATLWKEQGMLQRFVRVDGAALCGGGGGDGAALAMVALLGANVSAEMFLRAGFAAWRGQLKGFKFDRMARELADTMKEDTGEVLQSRRPRVSPEPQRRPGEALESSLSQRLSGFVAQLLPAPSCAPAAVFEAEPLPPAAAEEPEAAPLRAALLARHQMQASLRKAPALTPLAAHGPAQRGALGQALQRTTLAAVHVEREELWRVHVRPKCDVTPCVDGIWEVDEVVATPTSS